MRNLVVIGLVLSMASFASAFEVGDLGAGVSIDVSKVAGGPAGTTTWDITVDSPDGTDWTVSDMLAVLTTGSGFVQNASAGSETDWSWMTGDPYDTYIKATGYPGSGFDSTTQVAGGSKFSGAPASTFTTMTLDIGWFDTVSSFPDGQIARLVISNDSSGSLDIGALIGGGVGAEGGAPIVDGQIVPEPVSILMLLLGAVGIIRRR